jgi:hypothetical protein
MTTACGTTTKTISAGCNGAYCYQNKRSGNEHDDGHVTTAIITNPILLQHYTRCHNIK